MSGQHINNSILPLFLLIFSLIVITNTEKEGFVQLGHPAYYNYILYTLITICLILILNWLTYYGVVLDCLSYSYEASCVSRLKRGFLFVGGLCWVIASYYFMGRIWYEDPTHSLPFYPEYWLDSTMNFSICPIYIDNKWSYVMADILVRIYSIIVILLTIFMWPIFCMVGIFLHLTKDITPMATSNYSTRL